MRALPTGLLLGLLLCLPEPAGAWGRKKRQEATPRAEQQVPAPASLPRHGALFPDGLPGDRGSLPTGLANASAQGCRACHAPVVEEWARDPHAGPPSQAFIELVQRSDAPECTVCHLPLIAQQPQAFTPGAPSVTSPNPRFDATLWTEGVSCAACHLRDGQVLTGPGADPAMQAPHPLAVAESLGDGQACASCHQLTWPGASEPLYDTWGEWERSPHAAVGVGCVSCHMGAGAGRSRAGHSHDMASDPSSALSLLVDLPRPELVRGGAPLDVRITVQNTGAGHHMPTGSPYGGLRIEARLLAPAPEDGRSEQEVQRWHADLARRLEPEPPFAEVDDSRLAVAGERSYPVQLRAKLQAPPGPYQLEVGLRETIVPLGDAPIQPRGPLLGAQRIQIEVD